MCYTEQVVLCELFTGERFWPTALASVAHLPEACDRLAVATVASLSTLSADAAAEAHSRWRRQFARARELLDQRCGKGRHVAFDETLLHFGVTRGPDCDPVGEEARSRSFVELILLLLRFHTETETVSALQQTASSEAPRKAARGPTDAAVISTQNDWSGRVTRADAPTPRLDCARALAMTRCVASARAGLEGGGGVISITTEQQQQQLWAWQVSLLPSRFLLVHGLLVGLEVCHHSCLSCSQFLYSV